jgi:LuxR family maltose regulon positive regulatory protein
MLTFAEDRRALIARRALLQRLADDTAAVTLVTAPAGSGKTALLRSWVGELERTAWVSVERDEHDPLALWLEVHKAVQRVAGGRVEPLTATPQMDGEAVVRRLVSELDAPGDPVWLVIDDLHELRSEPALSQLETLLARRPAGLRVVLATRHEPQLGLHRLRLAGELAEVRGPDLRFSRAETGELLAACGIELSEAGVDRLHERTEGWAAGLRLAALALAGHAEPERFVDEFSGSERTVSAYLLAEVLERQPDEVRRLLLRTSILERVSGPLADALTGTSGSEAMLQRLEEANAFVTALDAGRTWFRYHHLLADLLRLELRRAEPDAVPGLHRAAARWHEANGDVLDAVRHAQAAEDWRQAARLLSDHSVSLFLNGRFGTVLTLLKAFPETAAVDPDLLTLHAVDRLVYGALEDAAACIELAGRHAGAVPLQRRRRFEVTLGLVRLALARRQGDVGSVAGEVEALLAPAAVESAGDVMLSVDARALALLSLGSLEQWSARSEQAERRFEQALELARRGGRPYVEIEALGHLALADAQRRSFTQARARSVEALTIAEAHGWSAGSVVAVPLAMIGSVDVWQGRFREAEAWLDRAEAAALLTELDPALQVSVRLVRGRWLVGVGRLEAAIGSFRAAERLEAGLGMRHALTVAIQLCLVLTQLRLGDTAAARKSVARVSASDLEWGELRTAVAAVHLADGDPDAAIDVLRPVLEGSVPVLRDVYLVLAVLVDAMAHDALGEARAAEAGLERALEIAEADALLWPFVMIAPTALLARHPRHRSAHGALLQELLLVLGGAEARAAAEPLSAAELRVLRYLPSNLTAPEIGQELVLSTSTVKTHMRHIYAKLAVHRRSEAASAPVRSGSSRRADSYESCDDRSSGAGRGFRPTSGAMAAPLNEERLNDRTDARRRRRRAGCRMAPGAAGPARGRTRRGPGPHPRVRDLRHRPLAGAEQALLPPVPARARPRRRRRGRRGRGRRDQAQGRRPGRGLHDAEGLRRLQLLPRGAHQQLRHGRELRQPDAHRRQRGRGPRRVRGGRRRRHGAVARRDLLRAGRADAVRGLHGVGGAAPGRRQARCADRGRGHRRPRAPRDPVREGRRLPRHRRHPQRDQARSGGRARRRRRRRRRPRPQGRRGRGRAHAHQQQSRRRRRRAHGPAAMGQARHERHRLRRYGPARARARVQ